MIGASPALGDSNLITLVIFLSQQHHLSTLSSFKLFFSDLYKVILYGRGRDTHGKVEKITVATF